MGLVVMDPIDRGGAHPPLLPLPNFGPKGPSWSKEKEIKVLGTQPSK